MAMAIGIQLRLRARGLGGQAAGGFALVSAGVAPNGTQLRPRAWGLGGQAAGGFALVSAGVAPTGAGFGWPSHRGFCGQAAGVLRLSAREVYGTSLPGTRLCAAGTFFL
ncbi:MAG: hypothetical protein RR185_04605, partial [Angelakisella sp.]